MNSVLEGTETRSIRPGFRPPFTSETGRAAALKSAQSRQLQKEAIEALTRVPPDCQVEALKARLTLLRQAQTRAWRQAIASNDADTVLKFTEVAKVAFDQEQRLLRRDSGKATKPSTAAVPATTCALEPIGAQPSASEPSGPA